jgi:hypothetical protein
VRESEVRERESVYEGEGTGTLLSLFTKLSYILSLLLSLSERERHSKKLSHSKNAML